MGPEEKRAAWREWMRTGKTLAPGGAPDALVVTINRSEIHAHTASLTAAEHFRFPIVGSQRILAEAERLHLIALQVELAYVRVICGCPSVTGDAVADRRTMSGIVKQVFFHGWDPACFVEVAGAGFFQGTGAA